MPPETLNIDSAGSWVSLLHVCGDLGSFQPSEQQGLFILGQMLPKTQWEGGTHVFNYHIRIKKNPKKTFLEVSRLRPKCLQNWFQLLRMYFLALKRSPLTSWDIGYDPWLLLELQCQSGSEQGLIPRAPFLLCQGWEGCPSLPAPWTATPL